MANLIKDGKILWLETPKKGTPGYWTPGTDFHLGDTVIPSATFTIPSGKENVMFQCVGFIGKSGASEPTFPLIIGGSVVDNNIEWKSRLPSDNPSQISSEEYYTINNNVTVS
jgi:hypothetical protein